MMGCVLSIIYQYSTWNYHLSLSTTESLFWLQLQTSVICISMPFFVSVFVTWSRQKISKWLMGATALVSIVFLCVNIFSEFSIRFSGDLELIQYQLFTGEQVSRLVGSKHPLIDAVVAFTLLIYVWLIVIVSKLFRLKQYTLCSMLIFVLCLLIISSAVTSNINNGNLKFIYVGGLPFTILNLLACITISVTLALKTKSLDKQISQRRKLESVLSSLAKGVSTTDSNQFYVDMILELDKLSNAKMIFLCLYVTQNGVKKIEPKVVLVNKKIEHNSTYDLSVLPSELITSGERIIIEDNLSQQHPEIDLFKSALARGYINTPLKNGHTPLEGSLVLLFDRPISPNDTLLQTIEIFASRAGSEIRRNRLEKDLRTIALFDYQTKLPNLTQIHQILKDLYKSNMQNNEFSALVIFDLSKFTEVNRQFEFEFAEYAITCVGERLKEYSDENLIVGRTGGDKFVVIIRKTDDIAESLIKLHAAAVSEIIQKPISFGNRKVRLQCKSGAVVFPHTNKQKQSVDTFRCAEIALSQAKRDNVGLSMFDASVLTGIDRKLTLEARLENALNNNIELFAVYQPKVDSNGKLIGAEALARWINRDIGFVSPDEFIELAEHSGYIDKLGYWMISTVCKQIGKWQKQGLQVPNRIAINVSAYQLNKTDFVGKVLDILALHDIQPTQIELELTESGLLSNLEDCISKLCALRDAGFTIALDDFGTGYSSLAHLKDLPLDVLKIDRSFVNALDIKKTAGLARAIISIGHHMSMNIVAEGVEEREQVEKLSAMGCSVFQGYYFAKPMNAESFYLWANEHKVHN